MVKNNEDNQKKYSVWLPLIFALVLVVGMLLGMKLQNFQGSNYLSSDSASDHAVVSKVETGRIEELLRYIDARYVDKVERQELEDKIIKSIVKELDPHSNYITAKQLREVNEQLEGNFEGVGIEFMILDDTILVVAAIPGGPSEQVGIMAGDKLIKIEDSLVAGIDIEVSGVVEKLRGERGTDVNVSILRPGDAALKDFKITRDEIPLESVDVGYMLDPETGYIKVSRFSATTYREFMEELERMAEKEGLKNLVIDLRQNPGGYLQEATNILSQLFSDRDKLLVYTEGRTVHRNDYETTGKNFFKIDDVCVLIDEGSASASEILAGAVQDWDRGTVIGRRSFGKGLVQEQYRLKDGSALRLTVARYYTPSGRSIQKSYSNKEDYDKDLSSRYSSGELYSKDSIDIADTTKYYTANKRVVYGGGGIMPDIFLPLDSTLLNDYYIQLRQLLPQYTYRFVDANKGRFGETLDEFLTNYKVTDDALEDFINYAEEKGTARNNKSLATCKNAVKNILKARIARNLFGEVGFYAVLNSADPVVQKALQTIKKTEPITEN